MSSTGLDTVRKEVRGLLERSGAFQTLSPTERRRVAGDVVKIGDYLSSDPGWLDRESEPDARALTDEDPVEQLKGRLADDPGQVGQDFTAGAVREGTRAFGELVQTVDFPNFVSSLIQGVFQAIVDASIQQMEAFAQMLSAISKSVDDFAKEEISDGMARDHLRNKHPSVLNVDTSGESSRLVPSAAVDDADGDPVGDIARSVDLQSVDLDDPDSEIALVNAAKLEMARSRQQMLATMVLLGINRIVVTNGRINAKVVFDVQASDEAARTATASLHDERSSSTSAAAAAWSPWGGGGVAHKSSHKTTVASAIDDTSESKAQAKAQLSGDVRVNFRSDVVPLERMVDNLDLQVLTEKAQPPRRMAAGQQPAANAGTETR
ncbi:MAG: hypothetical protein AAF682_10310 [Planctomycetota bacterium]